MLVIRVHIVYMQAAAAMGDLCLRQALLDRMCSSCPAWVQQWGDELVTHVALNSLLWFRRMTVTGMALPGPQAACHSSSNLEKGGSVTLENAHSTCSTTLCATPAELAWSDFRCCSVCMTLVEGCLLHSGTEGDSHPSFLVQSKKQQRSCT